MRVSGKQRITKEQYKKALESLRNLKDGWDGYSGIAVTERATNALASFLANASMVPGTDGDIRIEWHCLGFDIEIDINSEGAIKNIAFDKECFNLFSPDNNSVAIKNIDGNEIHLVVDSENNFGSFDLHIGESNYD